MESANTPDKLALLLKNSGISDAAIKIIKEHEISGEEFLALSQEDLTWMNVKMGQIRKLLRLQSQYKPQAQKVDKAQIATSHPPYQSGNATGKLSSDTQRKSRLIKTNQSLSIYQLPVLTILSDEAAKVAIAHVTQGQHQHHELGVVLMMVGGTGVGKTTLINAIVNYIFGVQFRDNFRFKLIHEDAAKGQSKKMTDWVTAYIIPAQHGSPVPFTLTIIDTPGFGGEIQGVEKDTKLLLKQIHRLLSLKGNWGITHLNAIGFTAKSSDARLTPTQRYIFDSIISLFGNDAEKSIFVMTTFFDGQRPRVLDAIQEAKISYKQHFEFNSESVFAADDGMGLNHAFWKKAMEQAKAFLLQLSKMSTINTKLTAEVLDRRGHFKCIEEELQVLVEKRANKVSEMRRVQKVVDEYKVELGLLEGIPNLKNVPNNPGEKSTNCVNCKSTCHHPCGISNNDELYRCNAMDGNGKESAKCTKCNGKCKWNDHRSQGHHIVNDIMLPPNYLEELERKYKKMESEKSTCENVVQGLQQEADRLDHRVEVVLKEAHRCVCRLEEIALKPNPHSGILPGQDSNQKCFDRITVLEKAFQQTKVSPLVSDILEVCFKLPSDSGRLQVFKLPIVHEAVAGEKNVVHCEVGLPVAARLQIRQKVVLLMGATGVGKTTLINGMANYLFGVEWKNNFRFKLIADDEEGGKDQVTSNSKTKHITAYYFPKQTATGSKVPYALTVIDTLGFGDGGLEEGKRTFQQIRQLFMNPAAGIDQLDAVGFVIQSSLGRLTPTQQYIFDSILSIFGKGIVDNIFLMTTFADVHRPPVLDAVNEAGIKYQASFKFNNSALFVDHAQEAEGESPDEMSWKMGMSSFDSFFTNLGKVQAKSLKGVREPAPEQAAQVGVFSNIIRSWFKGGQ